MQAAWQNPNSGFHREKCSQKKRDALKTVWEDSNSSFNSDRFHELMAIEGYALSKAYKKHPEITALIQEVSKRYPRLEEIVNKQDRGIELTKEESEYQKAYYKDCKKEWAGYKKDIIGKEISKIYEELKKEYEEGIVRPEIIEYVKEKQEKEGKYKGVDFSRFIVS